MSTNRGKKNNNDIGTWVLILVLMFVLPPVGWILLLIKLGVFASKKVKGNTVNNNIFSVQTEGVTDIAKPKRKNRLDKKTGKGISFLLLLASIGFFIAGATMSISAITQLISGNPVGVADLIFGALWLLSGFGTFLSRNVFSHRFSRYKNYNAFMEGQGIVPISAFMQMAGVSRKVVVRDINAMINSGFLETGAYIDNELDCLVLSAEAAEKMRAEIRGAKSDSPTDSKLSDKQAGQYAANLAELREVNSFIKDESISDKVKRLEELTEKIFKTVEDNPQKQQQLRRFMNYYLPTTLKLVRSYATLEEQGVKGDNITSTKKSIDDVLNTLTKGFEQQLDQLFKSDAIDIASDISVLENLMQQDGLSNDSSGFQVATSGS